MLDTSSPLQFKEVLDDRDTKVIYRGLPTLNFHNYGNNTRRHSLPYISGKQMQAPPPPPPHRLRIFKWMLSM